MLDDLNKHMLHGYIEPGYGQDGRAGTRILENLWTSVIEVGTDYRHHISDLQPCWTSRASIQTCLYSRNHLIRTNSVADYEAHYVDGIYEDAHGNGFPTAGPWGHTLAGSLPATRVPITNPDHASLLRTTATTYLDDDVQARTGWFGVELARAGVAVSMCGKWNNQWTNIEPIPAGITHARMTPNTASGSQWTMNLLTYDGDNDWDGVGIGGQNSAGGVPQISYTQLSYSRGTATSVVYSSANDGELVVSGVSAGHGFVDPATLDYAQLVGLRSTANPLFTRYDYEVTRRISAASFACRPIGVSLPWADPGGSPAGATVFSREQYQSIYLAREICDFLQDTFDAGQQSFVYFAPHLPHNTGLAPNNYGQSYERMYEDAVALPGLGALSDPGDVDGLWFDGDEGALCGTANDPPSSSNQIVWQSVMQMLATFDDALGIIIDKLNELHGENWTILVTADNGSNLNGEQATRGNGGTKTTIWQGSGSPWMFVKGPRFAQGVRELRLTSHADIGLTILDLFGLTDNHMHEDRDGASWLGGGDRPSIHDSSHAAYARVIPCYGDWKATDGEGYVRNLADWDATHTTSGVSTCSKFVRNANSAPNTCKAYDVRTPSDGGDYETDEVDVNAGTVPTLTTFNSTFDAIDAARWDEQTNTNAAIDGTITG